VICKPKFRRGDKVYDKWWPWDHGVVIKVRVCYIGVKFEHAGIRVYDRAHQKYLVTIGDQNDSRK
jgi:hypothetical protein